MAAIDIGVKGSFADLFGTYYTQINQNNPANLSGKITTIDIYIGNDVTGLIVAIFEKVNGLTFTARCRAVIGDLAAGLHEGIEVDLDVVAGDYIGSKCATGNPRGNESAGVTMYIQAGDQTECVEELFTTQAHAELYLWGDGAEPAPECH
ncbi:hypothetical protein ES703_96698 [subsurface metagenome]